MGGVASPLTEFLWGVQNVISMSASLTDDRAPARLTSVQKAEVRESARSKGGSVQKGYRDRLKDLRTNPGEPCAMMRAIGLVGRQDRDARAAPSLVVCPVVGYCGPSPHALPPVVHDELDVRLYPSDNMPKTSLRTAAAVKAILAMPAKLPRQERFYPGEYHVHGKCPVCQEDLAKIRGESPGQHVHRCVGFDQQSQAAAQLEVARSALLCTCDDDVEKLSIQERKRHMAREHGKTKAKCHYCYICKEW